MTATAGRAAADLAVTAVTAVLDDVVAGFEPVTLAEIQALADLQTRIDRKYVLPVALVAEMLGEHPRLRALEIAGRRRAGYESVYFDTPDLASYRGAAHSRRRRFKVRTRSYTDSGDCVVEVKVKGGRGETVKERLPYPRADAARITGEGRAFVERVLGATVPDAASLVETFAPTLLTTYDRTTLVDPVAGTRVTCDVALRCARVDDGAQVVLDDHVLLESKSPGAATVLDRWLWARGHRPERISKYCVGLAALDRGLPANTWHRTLTQHFG